MHWQLLDKQQLNDFITSVKTDSEGALFNPISSQGKFTPLPFLPNFKLYRLTSFASMPIFDLDFLGDGQRFFYLDGTFDAIKTISDLGEITINAQNVIAYLNFYFYAVVGDIGEIFLVQNPDEYPFQDNMRFDAQPAFSFGTSAPKYEIADESDGGLTVETPVFMDGTLVRAVIRVDPTGRVHFLSQHIIIHGDVGTDTSHARPKGS